MGPWPTSATVHHYFQPRYASARQTWLQAVAAAPDSAQVWHSPHPLTGPDGEALAMDCLWLGDRDANQVVVLISATHGVEGYTGSAIQTCVLDLLNQRHWTLPDDTALCFIHGLNPWGFAWYRRCDEQGIDLNRHFVDFSQPLPDNPGFALLQNALVEPDPHKRHLALTAVRQSLGDRAYEIALSGGQYSNPALPFFGGHASNWSRQQLAYLVDQWQLQQRRLRVIDLHTGLGPWGHGELICDHLPHSTATAAAKQLFGGAIAEPLLGTSVSVPKWGLQDYYWHSFMSDRSFYLTLEFGSYATEQLFDVLIEDHQQWGEPGNPAPASWPNNRDTLLEHFCPNDVRWRQSVLFRGLQVTEQLLGSQPW